MSSSPLTQIPAEVNTRISRNTALKTASPSQFSKNQLHMCDYCQRTFPFKVALQLHIKDHILQYAFKCSICKAGFNSKYQFSMHQRKHTGDRPFKCNECDVRFMNSSNLQRHIRNGICVKNVSSGNASSLNSITSSVALAIEPIKINIPANLTKCSGSTTNPKYCLKCNETFTSLEDYIHHQDLHKTRNVFTCKLCLKNFCTLPRKNVETLGEDELYWRNKCMLCGVTCDGDTASSAHLQKHLDNNEDLYCKQCQVANNEKTAKVMHTVNHHNCFPLQNSNDNDHYNDVSSNAEQVSTGNQDFKSSYSEKLSASETLPISASTVSSELCVEKTVPYTFVCDSTSTSIASSSLYDNTCINTTIPTITHINPFQTTYFTTNVNNNNNFIGTFYHTNINGQQRMYQSVCNIVPNFPLLPTTNHLALTSAIESSTFSSDTIRCSNNNNIITGQLLDGGSIMTAATTSNIVVVNPAIRNITTTESRQQQQQLTHFL